MLLRELVTATSGSFGNGGEAATTNPQATPLLHHMAAAHAYIQMFVTVNRTGQNDIRNILVSLLFPSHRRGTILEAVCCKKQQKKFLTSYWFVE